MPRVLQIVVAVAVAYVWGALTAAARPPAEPLLRDLPPGVVVQQSDLVPPEQTKRLSQKLGGRIERLSNSVVRLHGRAIQVNVVTAADEAGAERIHAAIGRSKPAPYSIRRDRVVVEYVGQGLDEAIATKASYELGLAEKPASARYRVTAELALVDRADYMACNPLFQQFEAAKRGEADPATLAALAERFVFGRTLSLRSPVGFGVEGVHRFQPEAEASRDQGAVRSYVFSEPPRRFGTPYVTATVEVRVDERGLLQQTTPPGPELLAATPHWPSEDPEVVALAERITRGKRSGGAKAMAILRWLKPGKNLRYAGRTGSRWGTDRALEQRFGHCWDFSDCFVTLARAAGVPARQVAGWIYGASGHVWAEFYREGVGWQQVDATGGGELRSLLYHIPIFTSEDGEMPIVYLGRPAIELVSHESGETRSTQPRLPSGSRRRD